MLFSKNINKQILINALSSMFLWGALHDRALIGNGKDVYDYSHTPTGAVYMIGDYLEKSSQSTKTSQTYI